MTLLYLEICLFHLSTLYMFLVIYHSLSTLGARDFSSAVSGFCQVFIGTCAATQDSRYTQEENLLYLGTSCHKRLGAEDFPPTTFIG